MLPSEFWAQSINFSANEFTLDIVEAKLKDIFGQKSKKDLWPHLFQSIM
jgi:hypothetical protein